MFVAVLLLPYKEQQWNNPLASIATCLCRQMGRHQWTTWNSNRLLRGRPRSQASLGL